MPVNVNMQHWTKPFLYSLFLFVSQWITKFWAPFYSLLWRAVGDLSRLEWCHKERDKSRVLPRCITGLWEGCLAGISFFWFSPFKSISCLFARIWKKKEIFGVNQGFYYDYYYVGAHSWVDRALDSRSKAGVRYPVHAGRGWKYWANFLFYISGEKVLLHFTHIYKNRSLHWTDHSCSRTLVFSILW